MLIPNAIKYFSAKYGRKEQPKYPLIPADFMSKRMAGIEFALALICCILFMPKKFYFSIPFALLYLFFLVWAVVSLYCLLRNPMSFYQSKTTEELEELMKEKHGRYYNDPGYINTNGALEKEYFHRLWEQQQGISDNQK